MLVLAKLLIRMFSNQPQNRLIAFHSCSETKYIFTSLLMWPFLFWPFCYVDVVEFHCGHFGRGRFGLWPFWM